MNRDLKDWSITKELATNSCVRTLIFGSSSFITFLCLLFSFFIPHLSPFLCFNFLLHPPLFFYCPSFFTFVFLYFSALMSFISSLLQLAWD
jgi:hypothetical protein